jgi:TPR repeat protein
MDGHSSSQLNLGFLYENGLGVKKNLQKSFKWFNKAAKNGNPMAQFNVGTYYYFGMGGVPKNYEKAFEFYLKSAENGFPEAQEKVAEMYGTGKGVELNREKYEEWIQIAYGYDNLQSRSALPPNYILIHGVPRETSVVFNLDRDGSNFSYPRTQYILAKMLEFGESTPQNLPEALNLYTLSAEQGYPKSQSELGKIYRYGKFGVEVNFNKSLEWYHKAAAKKEPKACLILGDAYYDGELRDRYLSKRKAFDYYKIAADFGIAKASLKVAQMYFNGEGVRSNLNESYNYYVKAADRQDPEALFNLGKFYHVGMVVDKNLSETIKYYNQAASYGHNGAMFSLACMYKDGEGVKKDMDLAVSLFRMAADDGHEESLNFLNKMKIYN